MEIFQTRRDHRVQGPDDTSHSLRHAAKDQGRARLPAARARGAGILTVLYEPGA
ncbi:hypothetical protein ACFYQA_27070 [Streptomyces sp. NPDC005774]|uniref:hypothetical protein n=1 Tax=Streptomyces sp. NPDC005774 TaxID=3364728 RepID=UPI0036AF6349